MAIYQPKLVTRAIEAWRSSILTRVVVSTIVMSLLICLVGGALIFQRVTNGVLEGKRQAAEAEASTALARMQDQITQTDLGTGSLYERLGQLAVEMGSEPSQYGVIVEAGSSVYISRSITASSVPDALRDQVEQGGAGLWVTPTSIVYQDSSSEPGLVIGGNLQTTNGQKFPVYFLFPQSREIATLDVVWQALASVGVVLLIALSISSWLISRRVTSPVVEARNVALRIADGDLDERMKVRGYDEIADLGKSMNSMAATLQHQISQLEDLSKVQQQFVSDVSHELRTPLTTMRMAVDVLYESRDELPPTQRRTTELLGGQINRFEVMLADLLEISRFDAGAAVLSLEETNLTQLVSSEIGAAKSLASQMGADMSLDSQGDCIVECDPRRIRRIVRNLLSNAIEHGRQHPIEVRLAGDDDCVAVTVRDHGVGFQADQAELVFHRFWRADPSRNRVLGGTGLGLAIALADAHLHNGWLEAWGKPGCGAQFRLTLPKSPSIELTVSALPLEPEDNNA